MATFTFTLVLDGVDVASESQVDALAESCPAGMLAERDGVVTLVVVRDADDAFAAVEQTVQEVTRTGARVAGLDFDLVAASDIAERTGRSRQSVLQLVTGMRGPHGFPHPLGWVGDGIRVWDWSSVNEWFRDSLGEGEPERGLTRGEAATVAAWLASGCSGSLGRAVATVR
jgi:hypothetical protein